MVGGVLRWGGRREGAGGRCNARSTFHSCKNDLAQLATSVSPKADNTDGGPLAFLKEGRGKPQVGMEAAMSNNVGMLD